MASLDISELNTLAKKLKSLHVPGDPVILANVHDASAAEIVASDPACKAIASASWSVAASQGIDDDDMTLEENLQGLRNIVRGVVRAGKIKSTPMTFDLQDGYQDIKKTIKEAIALGGVGANIEDVDCKTGQLRTIEDATNRVKLAVEAAKEAGVPDFVVNARTDVFGYGGTIHDAIERGAAYLAAGAVSVFVWGRRVKDIEFEEMKEMCDKLHGQVSAHGAGAAKLTIDELRRAGVNRISIGPRLYRRSMEVYKEGANALLTA